jgi:hypothetical protein
MQNLLSILIVSIAVWRISSLFAVEDAPFSVFSKIRLFLGNNRQKSVIYKTLFEGIKCKWCNSIWFGVITVILWIILGDTVLILFFPFFISAFVIVFDNFVDRINR